MRRVARLVQYVIHYPRRSRHRTVPGYRLSPAFAQSTSTGAILLTRIHGRAVSPIPDRCDRARPPTHNCPVSTDSTLMHDARAALPASQSMLSASHHTGTRARARKRQRMEYGGRGPRPPHMSDDRPIRKSPRYVSVTRTRHGIAGPRGTRRTADRQVTRTVREYACVGFVHRRSFRVHTGASWSESLHRVLTEQST